jgi:hypothetical protein
MQLGYLIVYSNLIELIVNVISHFPIEQRTGSSRLFGGTKNKQYAEYGI